MLKKIFRFALYFSAAVIAAAAVFYLYENRKPDYIRLSAGQKLDYSRLLEKGGLPPAEYVAASLKRHQVVLIGEPHRGNEDYLFVAAALGPARSAARFSRLLLRGAPGNT